MIANVLMFKYIIKLQNCFFPMLSMFFASDWLTIVYGLTGSGVSDYNIHEQRFNKKGLV